MLKPLLLSGGKKDRAKLPELVPQWEEEIRSAELPEHEEKEAAELLICAVTERFSDLTLEEVKKMIQLTPLDQTVAGRELIQIGRDECKKEFQEKTARNLLSIGKLTVKEISWVTGLSIKEVQTLRKTGH